ncbi:MAG TPA: polysaccharide biosynthesis/export family protein [Blastocatellia bacterium]|nr:polysaccharide biosynthesis/export family protein [Blastocatellia bacterium]
MRIKFGKSQQLVIKSISLLCFLALCPVLGSRMDCQAQGKSQKMTTDRPLEELGVTRAVAEVKEDYKISPGDVIEIHIDRAPELSGTFRVSASGSITMGYLGRVTVNQKTTEELSQLIGDGLRGRYLKNPRVTVTLTQLNSHVFFIQGSVNRPGPYQMEGRPSLVKLITVAGGLSVNHGTTAFIIREIHRSASDSPPTLQTLGSAATSTDQSTSPVSEISEDERYELVRVSINGLFRGDFDKNMYIEPGSIVNIPPADVFFVAGEVKAPGHFPFREGTTLRQAISLAQGLTFKAASARAIIFREDMMTKKRMEIKVDVADVMNGKKEDIAIMANDMIIIPNSMFKSVGATLLTTFGLGVLRNSRF